MKKRFILSIIALGLVSWLAVMANGHASAQSNTNNSGQALEIGPPVISLSVDPGQTVSSKISIRNISNARLIVTGQINDFVAAGETGAPKLLLDPAESKNNPYSIIDWVSPMPSLDLQSKKVVELPITINVPENASPGGHYGIVRFTGVAPEMNGTGVALSASLGSLIMIRVSGDIKNNLSISDFYASQNGNKNWIFESAPLVINERIQNSGNTHEQPSGQVVITDMFGNNLATLGVNAISPPGNVLPGSTRLFSENLDSTVIGNKMLFGPYTVKLNVKYGNNKTITSSMTFWVIPFKLIAAVIITIITLFFVLRLGLRRYNKHIISKATGTHHKKTK